MKPGYAALFGLVVAYSAYHGASSPPTVSSPQGSRSTLGGATPTGRPAKPSQGVEAFPTIAGGMCRLTITGVPETPCRECNAICPARELSDLIKDYFAVKSGSDDKYLAEHWNVPKSEQASIKFVFASLPDPVHTHTALVFDRKIESIQSAAQASGYLFSRAWMPWDISTHGESTDFTVRMAQAKYREQVESLPGLMIFRGAGGAGQKAKGTLFVFVTGETPTGGLHVEQFLNALNIRRSILAGGDSSSDEAKTLRIDGPEFSGSLQSLNAILNSQPHDRFSRVVIRSGTVSSYHAVREFCESVKAEWSEPFTVQEKQPPLQTASGALSRGRPDFATFQFSDTYQEYYLGAFFFKEREHLHSHVAILSEDETSFGNQDPAGNTTATNYAQTQSLAGNDVCPAEPAPPDPRFVRLYFPREIAQLRDAYQRDLKIQSTTEGIKTPPQTGLALSLSVTGNDDDSVAPYSPLQTPLSQESVLQGIVATLRKLHAKVVIIRATDPLDTVFLSRYLRQNYPQARLVTVGADLLMVHDYYDPRFHGILAVSPYPLITAAEFPVPASPSDAKQPRQEVERLFVDSYSAGDFNAFRSLLENELESNPKYLPKTGYTQFGYPSFLQDDGGLWRAHLWLTAVGREGFWPVAVLDDAKANDESFEKKPESSIRAVNRLAGGRLAYSVHLSVGWTIFWMVTFGLTIFLAFVLAYPREFSNSEVLGRFGGERSGERGWLLFVGSILLLIAQTLFVFPIAVWLGHHGQFDGEPGAWHWLSQVLNGMWLVMICYLASAVALALSFKKGFNTNTETGLARIGVIICGALLVATVSLTAWMWAGDLDNRLSAFVYRYIHVDSGVSPFMPLLFLLAAWIWWSWQSLTGVSSTEEKHVVLPEGSDFDREVPFKGIGPRAKAVLEASVRVKLKALASKGNPWPWKTLVATPSGKEVVFPAIAGLCVILLLMHPGEIAEAFETTPYKWIYWGLLYSCLFLVCYLVVHIVRLWLEFRMLLRAIEAVPLRRGFGDLKMLTWKPLWKLAGSGRQEFLRLLGGEMDALTQIQNGGTLTKDLELEIQKVRDATDLVSAEYEQMVDGKASSGTVPKVRQMFQCLQDQMARTTSEALIYASQQWKQETYTPSDTGTDAGKNSEGKNSAVEAPANDLRLRAVERFLCLFYLNVILVPLRRLQTLILAIAGVFVFVLISYSSYPFESRESFHVLLISIFFGISLVVGIVYGQMYSNPLLSRITNTKPGELGLDFWVRLGTFVFVPLLSLLSVQFPEINNFLFSWLQPALQSIK
jgi:hypothetical protein